MDLGPSFCLFDVILQIWVIDIDNLLCLVDPKISFAVLYFICKLKGKGYNLF